jgi:hypothetical protein
MNDKIREGNRERQKRFREKNRELCLKRALEIKKRYILERRCTSCSSDLEPDDKKTCKRCRRRNKKGGKNVKNTRIK